VPALSVDAPIVATAVRADRSLVVPEPAKVGWWVGGAAPGDTVGTTVLAGHVDTAEGKPGALYPLSSVKAGDRLLLGTTNGPLTYKVVAFRTYLKTQLPVEIFSSRGPARLVVITCGGSYQPGKGYSSNTVVYAVPTRG
jgi:hypothetical protein